MESFRIWAMFRVRAKVEDCIVREITMIIEEVEMEMQVRWGRTLLLKIKRGSNRCQLEQKKDEVQKTVKSKWLIMEMMWSYKTITLSWIRMIV